jgi:diketogulonate reductase-like aldo/keto reductase
MLTKSLAHHLLGCLMAMERTGFKLKYPLNDGNFIPALGLGLYQCSVNNVGGTERSVSFALQQGYRMVDTAEMYE